MCHYQIRRHGEDAFFSIEDKVKILHGLDMLVEFYQQAANGLVTKLTKHIRKDRSYSLVPIYKPLEMKQLLYDWLP